MKKLLLMLLSGVFVFGLAATADAKKLLILKTDKGEVPDDYGEGTVCSLSEENSADSGGFSLKLELTKPTFVGQFQPKRGAWAGYKSLCFNIFSTRDKDVKLTFIIKNEKSEGARDTWCVLPFTAKPGMNDIKLPVDALKTGAGSEFTLEKIKQWDFGWKFFPEKDWEEKGKDDALTVYVSKLRLED